MLVTVYCVRRDLSEATFSLQVSPDLRLHDFRGLCALECGVPADEIQLLFLERLLADDGRSLGAYGLRDGDVALLLQKDGAGPRPPARGAGLRRPDGPASGGQGPARGRRSPAPTRSTLLATAPAPALPQGRKQPPAEAPLGGGLETLPQALPRQQTDRALRARERLRLVAADPFDLEAQARIEEEIRRQNIEENMSIAMEEAPESFGQVTMLYINCKVNGHPLKAFVDSGAQMTIVSQACAGRCNIIRLLDRRWAGIAKGVGTQRIIGRVHLAQMQIEGDFLQCSFSVLEEQPMDMLLGLDMLRRHQCCIDLKKNVLVIGTTGTQTRFLPEGELPPCAKLVCGAGQEGSPDKEAADTIKHSGRDSGRTKR
ncbi:protein DDI1 homolog 1 [Mirounga angustirostris]|uniref:protein DDI1 homolog 1 n=1 Tax=Mirounga angustirostris TaxID=9716 RepID=UPI001E68B905|nr:protein DDI1 homolog 1 [Mirounga angustirostris]